MAFVFDDENVASLPAGTPVIGGDDTGFVQNFQAAKNLFKLKDKFTSRKDLLEKEWQPIVDDINARTGAKLENPATKRSRWFNIQTPDKRIEENSKEVFEFINNNQQILPEYKDLTLNKLYDEASKKVATAQTAQEDIAQRQTTTGLIGEFAGYAVEAITDPINIGVTVTDIAYTKGALRGALLSEIAATTIAKEAFRQAVINAGAEAVIQTEVSKWYKDLKLPYDYTTFLANVGAAGVGAGVLTGGIMGAVPAYQFTKKQMIEGVEALNKAKAKMTGQPYVPDETLTVVKNSAEIDDIINQQNIFPDDAGNLEHNAKVEEYIEAIDTNNITKALTGEDIPEQSIVKETVEEDLTKFDGGQSVGEVEQTDLLLAELRDNISAQGDEYLNQSIPMDKFDPVTKDTVQSAMTVREIVEELEQDKKMIDRLTGCLT
jgi:hypothetical protein